MAGQDIISIKNLQLPFGVIAPDVWGKAKEQPALVSITLVLKGSFSSAASKDKLDSSTIHYGELAKRIRATCKEGQTAGHVSASAEKIAVEMARKGDGNFILARASVEVELPKASMHGEGLSLISVSTYDEGGRVRHGQRVFTVKNVKVMTLIGVNGYERRGKQPIIASVWLYLGSEAVALESGQTVALFNLEQAVVQIIQDTSFETLESLADFTVQELQTRLLKQMLPGSQVQLRLEKPRAIAFADAPAVEVFREVPGASAKRAMRITPHERQNTVGTIDSIIEGSPDAVQLNLIRPYV